MKLQKVLYWVFTILLCLMMLGNVYFYFAATEDVGKVFESLGYPTALVIPLAIAKFLAVVAILSNKSRLLKRLAYYGLAIDFMLAFGAHLWAGDGGYGAAGVALLLLFGSSFYDSILHA